MNQLPKTVIRVDEFNAPKVGETKDGEETIYKCPFCSEKRLHYGKSGTPDDLGKLYINKLKNIGLCFRCNTIVVTNWSVDNAVDKLTESLTNVLSQSLDIDFTGIPSITLNQYPNASSIPEAIDYIRSRNAFITPALMDSLGLKWYDRPMHAYDILEEKHTIIHRTGIVTPIKLPTPASFDTKSFQIRFVTHNKARFYTLDGMKLAFTPYPTQTESKVTFCEGTWDAIALGMMGFPNPIALLGKTLTEFQSQQLRPSFPTSCYLCLDDKTCNESLYGDVRKKLPSVSRIKKVDFYGQDPEEYYVSNMNKNKSPWTKVLKD